MKARKIYLQDTGETVEVGGGGGGAGTAINVYRFNYGSHEMRYGKSMRLFIRCNADEILDTDEVEFWRCVHNKTGKHNESYRYHYFGWVKPRGKNYIPLKLVFIENQDEWDIWEIVPNKDGITNFEDLARAFASGDYDDDNGSHMRLYKKSGAIIVRDGVHITAPIVFKLYGDSREKGWQGFGIGR